mgnify:CR=1 FL=1
MSYLTAAVLALFVAYLGSWYAGMLEGNMALFLFVATLVTGVYWLAEKFLFLPKRRAAAIRYEQQLAEHRAFDGRRLAGQLFRHAPNRSGGRQF